MDLVAKEPALSGALLSSGLGADVLSLAAKAASRPISGVTATGLEGSFAQHTLTPGGPVDAASTAAGAVLTPETAVAEQVTYWASQGIQNAQLKLEGFGAEPIEVTISVKGQEAQIDFRTDQPELRQMLEGALVQLKETLAREGLVLSGVSVGSSGQESAGAQDRRQRPNTRQATVTTQEASPTIGLQRAGPVAGRSLDVFV
jgi:flagellar hook-length control protein FliK